MAEKKRPISIGAIIGIVFTVLFCLFFLLIFIGIFSLMFSPEDIQTGNVAVIEGKTPTEDRTYIFNSL